MNCKNCGTELKGPYCYSCGEKLITEEDKSIKKWFNEAFSNLVQLDGKVIRSILDLIFKPGRLAQNYFEGKRKAYVKMVNLFLIANLLYFLLPTFGTFKSNLNVQMNMQFYSAWVTDLVEKELKDSSINLEEYRVQYDSKTGEVSKLILIILAPFFGLVMYFLLPKKLFLTDCFNLSLQFWAAFILWCITPFSLLTRMVVEWLPSSYLSQLVFSDRIITIVMLTFAGIYLWFMLGWLKEKLVFRIAKVLVMLASFVPIFVFYRALLFFATYLIL